MWSHYADSHKGFCIEYDYSQVDEETLNKLPTTHKKYDKRAMARKHHSRGGQQK